MSKPIYPSPLYTYLNLIIASQPTGDPPIPKKILDCAAGGSKPPLGLFYEHGFETWGIDVSAEQVQKAQVFGNNHGFDLKIRLGDMRSIPFEGGFFDAVYEFYSLCHLSKIDTQVAIQEMNRVLKPGGLCFVGFMSCHSWPIAGREIAPGEFKLIEGEREVIHSVFEDEEPDAYFDGFQIIQKQKHTTWFRERMTKIPPSEWLDLYESVKSQFTQEAWERMYPQRISIGNYSHLFYIVRKS
jgi:ubiquinone/menaquinone biosynthesis C-methylase UbiE